MKKINLKVKGMHCTSCEMLINDALMEAGVSHSKADNKSSTVLIEFDETKVSLKKIREVIIKEGYTIE